MFEANSGSEISSSQAKEGSSIDRAMRSIVAIFNNQKKNVIAITLLAAVSAVIIVVMLWATAPSYKPLFADSDQYLTGDVIAVLESEGVSYELDLNSGRVFVLDGQVASTRMLLASKGVVPEKPIGLESLGQNSPLGTSQYIESARYKRGLEGELAMTIMSLDAVNNARVHLALPEQTLFVRHSGDKPSASVLVDLVNGAVLSTNQVKAIMNIVASSIPGMSLESVAVSDQYGGLLSSEVGSDVTGAMDEKFIEYQRRIERDIITRAKDVLLPIFGVGNFKVQATADLNFDVRTEEAEQVAGSPALISEKITSNTAGARRAFGIPGSLSNQPPPPTTVEAMNDQELAPDSTEVAPQNSQSERSYAQGTMTTRTQYRQGDIERMSVAVILNRDAAPNPELGWSTEEISAIEGTLATALGIMTTRGDSLVVETFKFAITEMPKPALVPWYENALHLLFIKLGVALLVSMLLIFTVLRPLVKHLSAPVQIQPLRVPGGSITATETGKTRKPPRTKEDKHGLSVIQHQQFGGKLPPTGSALDVQLQHLQLLADEDAERVSEVLKEWVHENE